MQGFFGLIKAFFILMTVVTKYYMHPLKLATPKLEEVKLLYSNYTF